MESFCNKTTVSISIALLKKGSNKGVSALGFSASENIKFREVMQTKKIPFCKHEL